MCLASARGISREKPQAERDWTGLAHLVKIVRFDNQPCGIRATSDMRISHGEPHSTTDVAVTIGNFDGVHLGHQAMLERLVGHARAHGLGSCVITFEPHPREFFTPEQAPVRLTSLREKLELYARYEIDWVHVFRFDQSFAAVSAEDFVTRFLFNGMRAKWILVGDDFRFGARRAGDFELLKAQGTARDVAVCAMDSVVIEGHRVSSTAVRTALAQGRLEWAARLLGRPYSISGRVVDGDKLGKQLGFPTANIQLKHNRPPLSGIFAVELCGLEGGPRAGVASLGVRPTVKAHGAPTLEVHIFDFEEKIYGQHVRVDFFHKLRDEEKYDSLEALVAQIGRDVDDAKNYFITRSNASFPSVEGGT